MENWNKFTKPIAQHVTKQVYDWETSIKSKLENCILAQICTANLIFKQAPINS